eukprot:2535852-Prymnesium_polylepis.1
MDLDLGRRPELKSGVRLKPPKRCCTFWDPESGGTERHHNILSERVRCRGCGCACLSRQSKSGQPAAPSELLAYTGEGFLFNRKHAVPLGALLRAF